MTFAFSRAIKPVSWCGERVKDINAHHHYWLRVNKIWYFEELPVWKILQAQGLEGYKENAPKKMESKTRDAAATKSRDMSKMTKKKIKKNKRKSTKTKKIKTSKGSKSSTREKSTSSSSSSSTT